jgi:hypothetical protein
MGWTVWETMSFAPVENQFPVIQPAGSNYADSSLIQQALRMIF